MTLTRRSLLGGIGALLAAPALVRAASLMPVKALPRITLGGIPLVFDEMPELRALFLEMQVIGDLMCEQAGIQPILMGGNF